MWIINYSTQALRLFLILVCGLCVFVGAAQPQGGSQDQVQIHQHLMLDASQLMDFDAARRADFSDFNPTERENFSTQVGWLRLSTTEQSTPPEASYLLIHPALFSQISLFTPSSDKPGQWLQTQIEPAAMAKPIALGVLTPGRPVYLRLKSAFPIRLVNFVGPQEAVQSRLGKIDIAITAYTAITLLICVVLTPQLILSFSWRTLAGIAMMIFADATILLSLGYGVSILGLTHATVLALQPSVFLAAQLTAVSIFCLVINRLFEGGQWVRWLWVIVAISAVLLAWSWVDAGKALRAVETVRELFAAVIIFILLLQARQSPQQLQQLSQKLVFLALLLAPLLLIALWSSWLPPANFWHYSAAAVGADPLNLPAKIFLVSLVPISLFFLINSTFGLARQKLLSDLHSEVDNVKARLGVETQRLDLQRQFTAMLSHELKNPLTASHMALSNIQQQLALDDPARLRADAIHSSLEEINAIVERCAEVDSYEQGQVPLRNESFSVAHLLASLQSVNSNERIYSLTRGVSQDLLITSDMTYLKVILNNFLSNALKYSPPESLVELSLEQVHSQPHSRLNFCVRNEVGKAGTPDPARVFERYYRAEAVRHQSGAGLGLWLAQSMAHALGSEIVMSQDGDKLLFCFSMELT